MSSTPVLMRFIIVFLMLCTASLCKGQMTIDSSYTIKTIEKEKITGKLIKISVDSVTLESLKLGAISIARSDIKQMFLTPKGVKYKDYSSEPYYIPTGHMSGQGNHYYRNYLLLANDFHFGVSDKVDMSFGFELLSPVVYTLFTGSVALPVIQLGAKGAVYQSDNTNVAVATKILGNNFGGGISLSVPFTFGGRRTNITIAPSLVKSFSDSDYFIFPSFNACVSVAKPIRLVLDAVAVENVVVGTMMIEVDFKGRFAMLFGPVFGIGEGSGFAIPNIALTVPFGKW